MFQRFLCFIGFHGPNWCGNDSVPASTCVAVFVRQCQHCGMKWYGHVVETMYMRTLGGWKTKEELVALGVWRGEE